ncbi:hypothetical protein BJ508DRAFT_378655 [Ascobolus immersus RN42]|uniref:F-box domain-containing protein n=1 Tax=Ascobolus immersus RN42 TaxID=1160509 RepID=A0A3N4HVG9_ASCIM|nr:hypothetical protein BJ508DRAFT_378655 [Ascobolus immersus RN42]
MTETFLPIQTMPDTPNSEQSEHDEPEGPLNTEPSSLSDISPRRLMLISSSILENFDTESVRSFFSFQLPTLRQCHPETVKIKPQNALQSNAIPRLFLLPLEILQQILLNVPITYLHRLRRVSSSLKDAVDNHPSFRLLWAHIPDILRLSVISNLATHSHFTMENFLALMYGSKNCTYCGINYGKVLPDYWTQVYLPDLDRVCASEWNSSGCNICPYHKTHPKPADDETFHNLLFNDTELELYFGIMNSDDKNSIPWLRIPVGLKHNPTRRIRSGSSFTNDHYPQTWQSRVCVGEKLWRFCDIDFWIQSEQSKGRRLPFSQTRGSALLPYSTWFSNWSNTRALRTLNRHRYFNVTIPILTSRTLSIKIGIPVNTPLYGSKCKGCVFIKCKMMEYGLVEEYAQCHAGDLVRPEYAMEDHVKVCDNTLLLVEWASLETRRLKNGGPKSEDPKLAERDEQAKFFLEWDDTVRMSWHDMDLCIELNDYTHRPVPT